MQPRDPARLMVLALFTRERERDGGVDNEGCNGSMEYWRLDPMERSAVVKTSLLPLPLTPRVRGASDMTLNATTSSSVTVMSATLSEQEPAPEGLDQ